MDLALSVKLFVSKFTYLFNKVNSFKGKSETGLLSVKPFEIITGELL